MKIEVVCVVIVIIVVVVVGCALCFCDFNGCFQQQKKANQIDFTLIRRHKRFARAIGRHGADVR